MLPPKEFRTIKQPDRSKCCGAAVCAMAVGESLEYAAVRMHASLDQNGVAYYRQREVLAFLGGHGIFAGIIFYQKGGFGRLADDELLKPIELPVGLKERPCVMVVRSKRYKNAEHLVFWDGAVIRDPNPRASDTCSISDYELLEIHPLTYIDESGDQWDGDLHAEICPRCNGTGEGDNSPNVNCPACDGSGKRGVE